MTDQSTPEQQLAAIRRKMAAPPPTPEQAAQWDAADRAMAHRVHAARPGVPTHQAFATLQTLRTIQHLDKAGEQQPATAPECLNDACTMDCTTECRAVIQRAWDALRRTGKTAATDAARQAAVAAGAHVHTASAADGIRCDSGECTRPDNSRTTADNPGPDQCGTCTLPSSQHSAACPEGRRLRQRDRSDAVPVQGSGCDPAQLLGADNHVCKPGATTYYCPTIGEVESDCHSGFDTCCARPDLHQPLPDPLAIPADAARALHDVLSRLLADYDHPGEERPPADPQQPTA